uniref:Uncharacterized protein n=1 Tax=Acrobeloides nanus TaxID=290746 RepID=A0A914DPV7_9BILA
MQENEDDSDEDSYGEYEEDENPTDNKNQPKNPLNIVPKNQGTWENYEWKWKPATNGDKNQLPEKSTTFEEGHLKVVPKPNEGPTYEVNYYNIDKKPENQEHPGQNGEEVVEIIVHGPDTINDEIENSAEKIVQNNFFIICVFLFSYILLYL